MLYCLLPRPRPDIISAPRSVQCVACRMCLFRALDPQEAATRAAATAGCGHCHHFGRRGCEPAKAKGAKTRHARAVSVVRESGAPRAAVLSHTSAHSHIRAISTISHPATGSRSAVQMVDGMNNGVCECVRLISFVGRPCRASARPTQSLIAHAVSIASAWTASATSYTGALT